MRLSRTDNTLAQLLSAIGSKSSGEHTVVEVKPMDWKRPRYFKAAEMTQLETFVKKTAETASEKLTSFFRFEYKVGLKSLSQRFGSDYISNKANQGYCLGFGPDPEHTNGILRIPLATANGWIAQILGDSGSDDTVKKMTQLEESLLVDIGTNFIKTFCSSHKSLNWTASKKIAMDLYPTGLQANDEVCEMVFSFQKTGVEESFEASVILHCSRLDAAVGKTAVESKSSSADISKAIINHLQHVNLSADIILDSTTLSLEDAMMLQEGDILVLDKKINQGADLLVQGVNLYQGKLAKTRNKKAFAVTGLPSKKEENN